MPVWNQTSTDSAFLGTVFLFHVRVPKGPRNIPSYSALILEVFWVRQTQANDL